jgi:hypothetical protein
MTHAARPLLALLALALSCAASGAAQPPRDKSDTSSEPSEAFAWTTQQQHSRANNDNVVTQAPYPLRLYRPQPREDAHVITNCTDLPGRTRQILPATSRRRHAFEIKLFSGA